MNPNRRHTTTDVLVLQRNVYGFVFFQNVFFLSANNLYVPEIVFGPSNSRGLCRWGHLLLVYYFVVSLITMRNPRKTSGNENIYSFTRKFLSFSISVFRCCYLVNNNRRDRTFLPNTLIYLALSRRDNIFKIFWPNLTVYYKRLFQLFAFTPAVKFRRR